MLIAAIQKEHTIVYFIESEIENQILSFFMWSLAIESMRFSKGKKLKNRFDDRHSDV